MIIGSTIFTFFDIITPKKHHVFARVHIEYKEVSPKVPIKLALVLHVFSITMDTFFITVTFNLKKCSTLLYKLRVVPSPKLSLVGRGGATGNGMMKDILELAINWFFTFEWDSHSRIQGTRRRVSEEHEFCEACSQVSSPNKTYSHLQSSLNYGYVYIINLY